MEQIISQIERGTVVTKFFPRKTPECGMLSFRKVTGQIFWTAYPQTNLCQTNKIDYKGSLNLREVKEVRMGKASMDFERWPDESKRYDPSMCFVVFYGMEFRLGTLSIAASSEEECELWIKGITFLVANTKSASYPVQLEMWLRREFCAMENTSGNVTLKNFKTFLPKINCKLSNTKLRDMFQTVDTSKSGEIGFYSFKILFQELLHGDDLPVFGDMIRGFSSEGNTITLSDFQAFHQTQQKEILSTDQVSKIINNYVQYPGREPAEPYLTTGEFIDFLFSKQNAIWDSKHSRVVQDMTKPLAHYWIASSHNTYLTGDQFSSESSVEAYARCLMMGCRCVELDCWDGPNGTPVIFHGHTLTSKINFLDVIKCIKKYAFVTSPYPVILSIEDHCSLVQQRKMAHLFQEVFGDMLVTQYLDPNENQLPSPDQLKRRIILKHKKLPDGADEGSIDSINDDFSKDMDLSNTIKNGIMFICDNDGHIWSPHFFVLTQSQLMYTEMTEQSEDQQDESVEDENDTAGTEIPVSRQEELHFSEKWFHGRLTGGRVTANKLLESYKHFGDGTFLVRESDTFVGEYTISFWRQGKTYHSLIHSKYHSGRVQYYLVESQTFDSIYTLITHYRSNRIRGLGFHLKLSEPVPQPRSHEDKDWYHGSIDRMQAEDKLKRIPHDGAFLVRMVQRPDCRFVISFKAEKRIKHCIVKEDGRLFTIGSNKFETLCDLVSFYEKHPFYGRVSLLIPVTEDLIRKIGTNPEEDDENTGAYLDYLDTNIFNRTPLRVRTLYEYTAQREDELSFPANAVILNVLKEHQNWWVGDYGNHKQQKFPVNYVQILEDGDREDMDESWDRTPLGNLQKGAVQLKGSWVELCRDDPDPDSDSTLPCTIKIYAKMTSPPFVVKLSCVQEAQEWYDAILETSKNASDKENQHRKIEKINGVAKELSNLTIYCATNKFSLEKVRNNGRIFDEMSSFSETAAEKLMCQEEPKFFVWHHQVQFSRVYPKAQRLDSSNYNPVPIWNAGCQMVALNYQTPDKYMQLNQGKFRQNGGCGYVLRPEFMFTDEFEPTQLSSRIHPVILSIKIIGARHLSKSGRGIVSPFVEIEIFGADFSGNANSSYTTTTIQDNGFNPVWNEGFEFEVMTPELAMIRFAVQDEDMFGDPNFIGQASYPVQCLKQGYRSIPLQNGYSEDLELATLLVHFTVRNMT